MLPPLAVDDAVVAAEWRRGPHGGVEYLVDDVDLSKMHTVGDLQGGIEEAERQLGFRVTKVPDEH